MSTEQLEAERKLYADDLRHLIVMQTQFGWNGETSLKLEEIQRCVERGWVTEVDDNAEYDITDDGEKVIAQALSQPAAPRVASDFSARRIRDVADGLRRIREVDAARMLEEFASAIESIAPVKLSNTAPDNGGISVLAALEKCKLVIQHGIKHKSFNGAMLSHATAATHMITDVVRSSQPAQPSVPVMLTLPNGFQFPLVRSGEGFMIDPAFGSLSPPQPSVPVEALRGLSTWISTIDMSDCSVESYDDAIRNIGDRLQKIIAAHDGKGE